MKRYSPAAWVILMFGGVRATGRAVGRDKSSVSLWQRDGLIPTKVQRKVLEMARRKDLPITAEDIVMGRCE